MSELELFLTNEYMVKYEQTKQMYDILTSKDLQYCPTPSCGAVVKTYFLWNRTLC